MKIPSRVRYFNKRFLNKLFIKIARTPWGPFCIIYHVGRRTGKPFETPLIAFPADFGFIIALTYGPEVDWYRNIKASGHCQIGWHNRIYQLQKIVPLSPEMALPYLPKAFRAVLSLVNLQDFIRLVGQSPRQG